MNTIWDIQEVVTAGVVVTERNPETHAPAHGKNRFAGALSTSLCAATLVFGPAAFALPVAQYTQPFAFATVSSKTAMHVDRSVRHQNTREFARGTDTQVGMSTRRLSNVLPAYFAPAASEPEQEEDYSFF